MKTFLIAMSVVASVVACSKEGKNGDHESGNHCPIVSPSTVPAVVVSGFKTKYPADSVIMWFKKDSVGYCAYFIQPVNQRKLAEFTPAGIFVSEELDIDHDGNFEDSTGNSGPKGSPEVCECEIPE
jgi:hypothetical protein